MRLTSKRHTLDEAVRVLRRFVTEHTETQSPVVPARFQVAIEPVDPFHWLAGMPLPHMMWGDRGDGRLRAMAGQAAPPGVDDSADVRACLGADHAELRAYVGVPFSQAEHTPRWLIPRFECDGETLTLNLLSLDEEAEVLAVLDRVEHQRPSAFEEDDALPHVAETKHWPDRNHWHGKVLAVLGLIEAGALEKVVLARRTDLTLDATVPTISLFRRLVALTPQCFHFYFRFAADEVFFGASPERLYARNGTVLRADVLAGTRPRGTDREDDERLERELLESIKDQLEHDIVRKGILQGLHRLCRHVEASAGRSVLKLASKQHIYSTVTAELNPGTTDGVLLQRLHPTPAIGGYPTENALSEIERLEPFSREWYAGPVGWIDGQDRAEFAVGIRSALARGKVLSLYAGAGIVEGSEPGQEWDEVENKIGDLRNMLP